MMTRQTLSVLTLAAVLLASCAGSAPSPHAPVIVAGSVCSGIRGLDAHSVGGATSGEASAPAGIVAALSEPAQNGSAELFVLELGSQRLLWKKSVRANARPQVLETVVVTSSGEELVAFDLATGAERFRTPLGHPQWIGAAQSGDTVVITTGTASWDPKQRGSSLIAVEARSGSERWRRDVPYSLSAPVARAGRALVVSDHADLWTLDLTSGEDTGCGAIGGNTVEWVDAAPAGLLFGAAEARQLGADAKEVEGSFELARHDLPGRPFIRGSSYLPVPAARSAHGRVAAIAPLRTSDQGPALAGDMFYFVFYRDVFGFHADGTLAWAQLVDADIARAQAFGGGLWLVTEAGVLLQLDAASGEPKNAQSLGAKIASADIRAGALTPAASAAPAAPTASAQPEPPRSAGDRQSTATVARPSVPEPPRSAGDRQSTATVARPNVPEPPRSAGDRQSTGTVARASVPEAPPPSAADVTNLERPDIARLQASLRRVADDTDARLLPARMLAVDELARLDSASATGDLLAIYAAPNTPSGIRERIAKRMRERTVGGEYLVAALEQHRDFLEQRPAPPLRAIVPGLVTQHETRAVPGLVDQLFDPNTPVSDLGMLVSAIDALSGDAGREPLRRFFSMYRADSSLASDPSALVLAAQGLLAREDAASRTMLTAARDDAGTSPGLREQLASLLAPPPAAAPEPAEVETAPVETAPPPIALRTLLDAARPQLTPCVEQAHARAPKLNTVRMWFVALPDGSVRDVRVTPIDKQLAACLEAKLSSLRLPNDRKQLVSYQLWLPPPVGEEKPVESVASDEFWARAEQRAPKNVRVPDVPPWWQDKNPLFVVMDQQGRPAQQAAAPVKAPAPAATPAQPSAAPVAKVPQSARAAQPADVSKLKPVPVQEPPPEQDAWWVPVQEPKK
jgi:hypothetical protein